MRNLVASVQQRLRNVARASGRPLQDTVQYYAMERFLYRLSQSPHAERFVLKGALMLALWQGPGARATRDIDVQGRLSNSLEAIQKTVQEVCAQAVADDGVAFDAGSVEVRRIVEEGIYQGVRAKFWGTLGRMRLRMQMDVSFGDPVVTPPPARRYPTILDMPAPVVLSYSPESAIAEKLEAMVKLGLLNARLKDYYDVWALSRQLDFRGDTLSDAVAETFAFRGTELVADPVGLSARYAAREGADRAWAAFLRRNQLAAPTVTFDELVEGVSAFLAPVVNALARGGRWTHLWRAPGPWQPE